MNTTKIITLYAHFLVTFSIFKKAKVCYHSQLTFAKLANIFHCRLTFATAS